MAIRPTIHLNGSSPEMLRDQLLEAATALTNALEMVAQATPNARDYYPQGDDAWRETRNLHDLHMRALREMRTEYQVAAEYVQERIDEMEERRRGR